MFLRDCYHQNVEDGFVENKLTVRLSYLFRGGWQGEDEVGWGIFESALFNFMDPLRN